MHSMFEESNPELKRTLFHEPYYKDLMLAAMVSRSKIGLERYRGCGKSHLMDLVLHLIKDEIVDENGNPVLDPDTNKPIPIAWRVQSYLDADIEDVMVRPLIPSIMRGEEELKWKPLTLARVKGLDEIQ